MQKRKRRFAVVAAVALLLVGVCSCSGGRGWGRKKPRYGGCQAVAACAVGIPHGVETWSGSAS